MGALFAFFLAVHASVKRELKDEVAVMFPFESSTLEDNAPLRSETEETHEALDGSWNLQDFSRSRPCHNEVICVLYILERRRLSLSQKINK